MAWSTAGVFTGTETDLTNMSSITGSSSTTVNGITEWRIPNQITISGTLTFDATVERIIATSTTQTEQLRITSGGTLNCLGGLASSSFGSGARLDSKPTAIQLGMTGTQCCSNGSVAIESGGRMNLYGVRIDLDSVLAWESGSGGIIRDSILYCKTVPGSNTTRIRCEGATNWDIQGLDLYNIQFDWLTDEVFIANSGIRGLNAGMPFENATGTAGATRLWRGVPDPRPAADAFGNNWQGQKDVIIELSEAGTGAMIVPDSEDGTGGNGHGGLIYHEYNITVAGSSAPSGKCFVRDTDNSLRKEITTPTGIFDTDADQFLITTITAGASTSTTDILIGHWYRNNSVGDLAAPDGNEILDARGKNDVDETTADDADRDLFDVYFKGLDWLPASAIDTKMNGLVATEVFIGTLEDTTRDSDSAATIAAYTSLPTDIKFWNAMKEWSVLDANLESPTSSTLLFSNVGGVITAAGAYDITLNSGTNATPFSFATNTVTAYTGTGFVGTLSTTGDITIAASTDVDGSVFTGDVYLDWAADLTNVTITGDLYIDTGADSTLTFTNVTVSGDVYNDATGNTLTINSAGGSSLTAGDPGTADGESNILQTVPIKVTVKDIEDGSLLENARVLIKAASGGNLPVSSSITQITRSGSTATATHTAHGLETGETIYISGANQSEYNSHHQVTVTGVNEYTYTVSGTPATPATGTIVGTAIIVNEVTDVDGEINETHRYTGDQPVDGWVRKATL